MSAEPTNIMPFPTAKLTLEQLVDSWIEAKREEEAANVRRLALEVQICELTPPKEEGSSTTELAGGMKLTITGKLTYKADMAKLRELVEKLPPELRPIKTEDKLDETGAKYLRSKEPALWAIIAPAIEVKPAKVGVKVGF